MSLTLQDLDDYLSRATEGAAADRFEELLFEAAARGDDETLRFLDRLRRSAADLARRGSYDVTLTVAELEALKASTKLRLRVFDPVADAQMDSSVALSGLDLAAFELRVPLAGVGRVDLELGFGDTTVIWLPDVKVDREHDRVILLCEGELARASFRPGSFSRVIAVEGDQRRTLAQFTYAPL